MGWVAIGFDKGYIEEKKTRKKLMFLSDQLITTRVGKQQVCTWLNQDDQFGFPTLCYGVSTSKFLLTFQKAK